MRCCIEWQSSAIPHKIGGKTPTRLWRHPDGWLAHRPLDHQRLDFGRQAHAALLAASSKQLASPSGLSSWPPQYHAWSADTACIQQKLAPHLKGRTNCSYHFLPSPTPLTLELKSPCIASPHWQPLPVVYACRPCCVLLVYACLFFCVTPCRVGSFSRK